MKKLFKMFLFSFLILPMVFCLTACKDNPANTDKDNPSPDGQIPVYTGMEVSADVPVVPSSLSSFNLLSASSMSNKNFYGDSKPDKDKDKEETDKKNPFPNKPSVEDEIKSSLEIVGGEKKTYYSAPNNEVFITILLDNPEKTLKVATKFANIARTYYAGKSRDIDIIHLNGSIEIAPILGLSDVIVDIVETGTTLKENDLVVAETILPISARLIANRAAFQFKTAAIEEIVKSMKEQVKTND